MNEETPYIDLRDLSDQELAIVFDKIIRILQSTLKDSDSIEIKIHKDADYYL